MPYTAVIFDYGNVLSLPQDVAITETMARRLRVNLQAFHDAYEQIRDPYDTAAISAFEYWQRVLQILDRSPMASPSTLEWLIDHDITSWTRYREEMWDLARTLRERGYRMAILSNCPVEILARIRLDHSLESYFDVPVFSCEVNHGKPDPEIYEICITRLGVVAGEVLFIDDLSANIAAATKLGLQTYRFSGNNSMHALQRLLNHD